MKQARHGTTTVRSHLWEGLKVGSAQSQRLPGGLVVSGPSPSGLQDEGGPVTECGMSRTPPTSTRKTGQEGTFYVTCTLPQFLILKKAIMSTPELFRWPKRIAAFPNIQLVHDTVGGGGCPSQPLFP